MLKYYLAALALFGIPLTYAILSSPNSLTFQEHSFTEPSTNTDIHFFVDERATVQKMSNFQSKQRMLNATLGGYTMSCSASRTGTNTFELLCDMQSPTTESCTYNHTITVTSAQATRCFGIALFGVNGDPPQRSVITQSRDYSTFINSCGSNSSAQPLTYTESSFSGKTVYMLISGDSRINIDTTGACKS